MKEQLLTKPPEERLSLIREPSGAMGKNSVREKQLRLKKISGFREDKASRKAETQINTWIALRSGIPQGSQNELHTFR